MLLLRVQVINSGEILIVYLLYDSTTNIILILLKVIGVFTYGHVGYTVYQLPSNKFWINSRWTQLLVHTIVGE